VSIFAWRLLRDRLPTKANLVIRGILSSETHFCESGCGAVESTQHLFLSCSTFGSLWTLVRSWIALHWWILILYQITLFSLLSQQVVFEHAVRLCNSFG
ncbi:glutamate-gated kainate-type ion channel receptor subunit GluR5, partial [Trifolium medium]|nr:glutamate-gated kainate-type ion channel receptor subunit GluR5 [Trifolium medium]